jgi:hypothetical protein
MRINLGFLFDSEVKIAYLADFQHFHWPCAPLPKSLSHRERDFVPLLPTGEGARGWGRNEVKIYLGTKIF